MNGSSTTEAASCWPTASASGGSSAKRTRIMFAPTPYRNAAARQATTAARNAGVNSTGERPTTSATPATPRTSPSRAPGVNRSPSQTAATTAPHSGAIALSTAASEASISSSAADSSANGSAALTAPKISQSRARPRHRGQAPPRTTAKATSAAPASATRPNESTTGPSAGTATRMNRNDAPQTAARTSIVRTSRGVIAGHHRRPPTPVIPGTRSWTDKV